MTITLLDATLTADNAGSWIDLEATLGLRSNPSKFSIDIQADTLTGTNDSVINVYLSNIGGASIGNLLHTVTIDSDPKNDMATVNYPVKYVKVTYTKNNQTSADVLVKLTAGDK